MTWGKEEPMTRLPAGGLALAAVLVSLVRAAAQPPADPLPGPPPGRFVPGRLLPEGIRGDLGLTDEQQKQLADLEKEIKERLLKILTPQQKQRLDELRRRGPNGPPGPEEEARPARPAAGIQWYATWESGVREAQRTGRPILLVSAAPHCAGVSGCW
jgi:Spy/CpxP family protein refolding chaperone